MFSCVVRNSTKRFQALPGSQFLSPVMIFFVHGAPRYTLTPVGRRALECGSCRKTGEQKDSGEEPVWCAEEPWAIGGGKVSTYRRFNILYDIPKHSFSFFSSSKYTPPFHHLRLSLVTHIAGGFIVHLTVWAMKRRCGVISRRISCLDTHYDSLAMRWS